MLVVMSMNVEYFSLFESRKARKWADFAKIGSAVVNCFEIDMEAGGSFFYCGRLDHNLNRGFRGNGDGVVVGFGVGLEAGCTFFRLIVR